MDTWAKVGVFTVSAHLRLKLSVCSPASLLLYVTDRSPHSTQRSPIHSATSAVEDGRSVRSPEADCHYGLCPCRARYSHTLNQNHLTLCDMSVSSISS